MVWGASFNRILEFWWVGNGSRRQGRVAIFNGGIRICPDSFVNDNNDDRLNRIKADTTSDQIGGSEINYHLLLPSGE